VVVTAAVVVVTAAVVVATAAVVVVAASVVVVAAPPEVVTAADVVVAGEAVVKTVSPSPQATAIKLTARSKPNVLVLIIELSPLLRFVVRH
jgi:hypothetical protein